MARPEAKLKELKTAELRHEVGARSELVVKVNRRSERRIIPYGEEFLFEKLPVGTRVIYPPPPLDPLADPDQAIRYALLHPENQDPLFAQLSPNMRVTIAIDDISLPLPQMRRPDIRERLLNQVLQTLADYGVDDVHLVIATSLHRRMTEAEIRRVVGERAFKQYWPDRLYNFDAENRAELAMLGKTDHGEEVWLSRRAAESDLLIYLNINLVPMDGGHKSVAVGLAPYQSLRHHHNVGDAARFAFVHGPDALGAASLVGPDGQADSRVGQHFSDRDRGEHADVRRDARLPAQERRPLHRLGSHAAEGLSVDDAQHVERDAAHRAAQLRGAVRNDRRVGGRHRGGASARRSRECSSNTRCR